MRWLLILTIFLVTGCAHSDPWTKRDTAMQIAATAAMACDAYTTTKIQYHDGVYESGPLASRVLGRQPATSDTYQYMATIAVSNYLISRALPAKWRPYWQGFAIADHGYHCGYNIDLMDL